MKWVILALLTLGCISQTVLAVECFTPLAWQEKLQIASLDENQNFVADTIEAGTFDTVDVILDLNRCPQPEEIELFSQFGTIALVGKYLSYVVLRGVRVEDAVRLGEHPLVAFVEEDVRIFPTLDVSTQAIKVTPSSAYPQDNVTTKYGYDGSGVNIAIIDSGVDDMDGTGTTHESFPQGKFIGGYDATTQTFGNPNDNMGHGTHVAGIALGTGGSSGTYRGVAPAAGLVDIKVFDPGFPTTGSVVMDAMQKVIDQRIVWNIGVVNMSLSDCPLNGSNGLSALPMLANRMVWHGLVVAVAAGNSSGCGLPPNSMLVPNPAAADDVITVANSNDLNDADRSNDAINPTSLQGPRLTDNDQDTRDERKPEIAAPGTTIRSAASDTIGNYTDLTGTSMAAPHVAGCAALMLQARPGMRPLSLKRMFLNTAEDKGAPGWDKAWGHGLIDCFVAIDDLISQTPTDLKFEFHTNNPGPPPFWASPDLFPTDPTVEEAEPNQICAVITNCGPNTVLGFSVKLGVFNFSNSQQDYHICTKDVATPLPPGGKETVCCPWTPDISGTPPGTVHACLKGEIIYPFDADFSNNRAQHNIDITQTKSPAVFRMEVVNPIDETLTIQVEPEFREGTVGWGIEVSENNFDMTATSCPKVITVRLDPIDTPQTAATADIAIRGRTAGGEIFDLGGMTVRGELGGEHSFNKKRMVPHVTQEGGGFTTDVILTNRRDGARTFALKPFTANGRELPLVEGALEVNQTLCIPSEELFGRSDIAHFQVSDDSPEVGIAYSVAGLANPAHITETNLCAPVWRIYPGNWEFVIDGLAIVNAGEHATDLVVRQFTKEFELLFEATILQNFQPNHKTLLLLNEIFPNDPGTVIQIMATQPVSLVALRFPFSDGGVTNFWETSAFLEN